MKANFMFSNGDMVADIEFPAVKFLIKGRLYDVDSETYYYRAIDLTSNGTEMLFMETVDQNFKLVD